MRNRDAIRQTMNSIIPRPKQVAPASGTFTLASATRVSAVGGEVARREAEAFIRRMNKRWGLALAWTEPGKKAAPETILFELTEASFDPKETGTGEESYQVLVGRRGVRLQGRAERGLYYAGLTFEQLLVAEEGALKAPCGRITDWPEFALRGLLVAPGQGFMPVAEMKRTIDLAAHSKLNLIHMHLTDNNLFAMRLDACPQLAGQGVVAEEKERGCYTKRDLKAIIAYAAERKVEIMPAIEAPGHAMSVLQQFPELRCQPPQGEVSMATMCLGTEATYTFLEKVIDEVAPLFPSRYFHIGTDEVEFLDVPDAHVFFNWDTCPACQERIKREGLGDVRGLFYYFVRRMREMLARHGKRAAMWNDQIDTGHPDAVDVPRDVLMHFWRIAAPGRGPWKDCTYERLLKLGFPIINSFFPETYIDIYVKEERLAVWNPLLVPPLPAPKYRRQVLGSTMCAWAHLPIYSRVLPSALPFFADRVWNLEPIDDIGGFRRRVARHVFGPQMPAELEVMYDALGGLILPLQLEMTRLGHVERSFPGWTDPERMTQYARMLKAIDQALKGKLVRDPATLKEYRQCLQWLDCELKKRAQGIGE